jgi:hypothetical protein
MSKKTYYQFNKELGLPIYLTVDLTVFEQSVQDFLMKMKFSKLSESEEVEAVKRLKSEKDARVLNLTEATALISKQIMRSMESDRYSKESIFPKEGYRVYRLKNVGLMIYSFGAREWQFGCYKDFGSRAMHTDSSMVINRYLSLALSMFGILGIWGVSVDEGMVAQRSLESKGEVVFIDILNHKIITIDGVKKMSPRFKVLRLDPTIRGRNIVMTNEEYLSFISAHCSFMDSQGLSIPVRQMIQAFVRMTEGLVHPEESFRPRTDLSL